MPSPDEAFSAGVVLPPADPTWAAQAQVLKQELEALVPDASAVEHIGSTAVPGLAAKDCLDMMVVVSDLSTTAADALARAGFRRRPEPWNQEEPAGGTLWPKMVFAPPVGGRSTNIHVRLSHAPTTRRALLFRDFLQAESEHARTWSALKTAAAAASEDLFQYGAIKDPAWKLLMDLAEHWAAAGSWSVPFGRDGGRERGRVS